MPQDLETGRRDHISCIALVTAIIKMLMVWVFDLSRSFDLFALTFTWEKLWALGVVVSAEALRTLAMEWRAPEWSATALILY